MTLVFLQARLQKRKERGELRALLRSEGWVDFASNDYFGFSVDLLKRAPQRNIDRVGATGSRLLTGNHLFCEELEEKIAHLHRAESCLIYNSGYSANLGLIAALGTEETTFVYDLEVHASMIDGMRLSKAKSIPFRHNDLDSLEGRLKRAAPPTFVLLESLYSISGDFAPLKEIAVLCARYGAALIVDEAHATGICGPSGMGCVVEGGLESEVFARVHTFSKALGSQGACILGSRILKEYLINFSRPLIYTTALPLSVLLSIEAGYEKLREEAHAHQLRLRKLIAYFQKKWGRLSTVHGPIQPIYVSGREKAYSLSEHLRKQGLDVRAIIAPTVKRGKECLRVVLHSFNREEEIDRLVQELR